MPDLDAEQTAVAVAGDATAAEQIPHASLAAAAASDGGVTTTAPAGWSGAVWLDRTLEGIVAVALVSELGSLLLNIFSRAVLGSSILWTQEVAELALITVAFIGGAIAYPKGAHTSVDAVVARLPRGWRPATTALVDWFVLAVGAAGLALSVPTLRQHWAEKTPIMHLRVFWLALPLSVGMLLIAYFAVRRLAVQPRRSVLAAGAGVAAIVAAVVLSKDPLQQLPPNSLLAVVLVTLLALLLLGVPIGFVLVTSSVLYLYLTGVSPVAVPLGMETGAKSFVLLAIPFFILAGGVMTNAGLTRPLAQFVESLLGHVRGGLLQVVVVTMYIFSGISGSKVADVAAVGSTMRGMLDERGHERGETAAVLSASAIMGETIPPSIAMLVLGSVTSISTSALFLAGIVPAGVLGLCLMALIYVRARKSDGAPLARASWSSRGRLTLRALPTLVLPVGLVGGILFGVATPTEISAVAVLYALVLAVLVFRSFGGRVAWRTVAETATTSGMVLFIIAAASPFAQTLSLAGVPQQIESAMGQLGGSRALFLIASIITLAFMGQLLEGLPAILVFGPLLIPLAQDFNVNPIQYALILIFAMGIGSFAPPAGLGFYVACAVGRATFEKTVRHLLPYLAVLLVGLLVVAFVPWFSLVLPRLFGLGSP
jgi:tripartite ATP-independent transporter DctM subunit